MTPPLPGQRAAALRANAKELDASTRKKLHKINTSSQKDLDNIRAECVLLKKELDRMAAAGETETHPTEWKDKANNMCLHMKQVIEGKYESQRQLLAQANLVAAELESRAKPLKKELPSVLDFSEEDRVQLIALMDRTANEVIKTKKLISDNEEILHGQVELLDRNSPGPGATKVDTIAKLNTAFEMLAGPKEGDGAGKKKGSQKKESGKNIRS